MSRVKRYSLGARERGVRMVLKGIDSVAFVRMLRNEPQSVDELSEYLYSPDYLERGYGHPKV
jgi:hypothetical protein